MLNKFISYAVLKNDKMIAWIEAYLTTRHQFVSLNKTLSDIVPVKSGVPQGSVLGPLFFLLYINDIVANLSVEVRLYTDDCVLYEEITTEEDQLRLNGDFNKVVDWCKQWQMCINFEKIVYMRVTLKKKPLIYCYGTEDVPLSGVTHYIYLGLYITSDLSWSKHLDTVLAKCHRELFFLRRALKLSTLTIRLLAYKTLVRPALEYALIIWDPFTKTDVGKLESLQKKSC